MKQAKIFFAAASALAVTVLLASCASFGAPPRFTATLAAAPGVQTSASGQATFQLSADGQSMTYTLTVTDLVDVTMAHIHVATAPGKAGDVAVWLYPPKAPPMLKAGSFSGTLAQGTFTAASFEGPLANASMADLLDRIKSGLAYVNVHTNANAGGEIQGVIGAAAAAQAGSSGKY